MSVDYALTDDGIAVLTVRNPPVNALSHAVRQGLWDAMDRAEGEAKAALILGEGRTFIAGADISEFGKPPKEPTLPDLVSRIEASPLPVIAALHGTALGGGLEVALGAHYRVAVPGAKVGLPEVTLGIMPGAGGTQRLPRLSGSEAALKMITSGAPVGAEESEAMGIVDAVREGTPEEAGLAFAREVMERGPRPVSNMAAPEAADWDGWHARILKAGKGQIAPAAAVRAVQAAAEKPFADGLAEERRLFLELMDSPQREGLIHAFFAERRVVKIPETKDVSPRNVERMGVVGGGTMGAGIAAAALLAGLKVTLVERDDGAAAKARETVLGHLGGAVKRGKLAPEALDRIEAEAFAVATDYGALSDVDLAVEAVFEEMGVKKDVFASLDKSLPEGAILATNTSYLDVDEIAAATSRPGDVIGLHFFSPAHVMKLLEIVVAGETAPDVTATAFALAKRLRKTGVKAGVCDGFIGNRILSHYRMACDNMVLDGASPYEIDRALVAFGMAMGPYAVSDLAGLDIGAATRKRKASTRDPRERVPTFADRLADEGRLGRKAGRGYYTYPDQQEDPSLEPLLAEERDKLGIAPRAFGEDEIQRRFMAAMVNEAARVVDEGIAQRPSDVDVVLIAGYGFPRWRGGPMKWADMTGIEKVLVDIRAFGKEDEWFWQPAPLLERLAEAGRTFDDLNEEST